MKIYFKWITENPKVVLTGILILSLLFGMGLPKLEIRNNSDSDLPESDPIVATKERIDDIFGEKSAILIGVESDNIYEPKTLQKIADLSLRLQKIKHVIPTEITSLSTINNVVGSEDGLVVGDLVGV